MVWGAGAGFWAVVGGAGAGVWAVVCGAGAGVWAEVWGDCVGDWAVVAAGASITLSEDGSIGCAGIALAAVGSEVTSREAEQLLAGQPPSEDSFKRAAAAAAASCRPVSDQRGSAEYKRHVAGVLTERALLRAAARALPKRTQEV